EPCAVLLQLAPWLRPVPAFRLMIDQRLGDQESIPVTRENVQGSHDPLSCNDANRSHERPDLSVTRWLGRVRQGTHHGMRSFHHGAHDEKKLREAHVSGPEFAEEPRVSG